MSHVKINTYLDGNGEVRRKFSTPTFNLGIIFDDEEEPTENTNRFENITTSVDIHQRMKENIPKKTQGQNRWAVALWNNWIYWRKNINDPSLRLEKYKSLPEDLRSLDEEELGFWLTRFILEIRRKDGNQCPPNTLYQIACAIQRHYNDCSNGGPYRNISIFEKNTGNFHQFQQALDNKMRELSRAGVGEITKQADPVLSEDEHKLYKTKTISLDSSQGLLYGVYFYNTRAFGLRGGEIHRKLVKNQYAIGFNLEAGVETLVYRERVTKASQRVLKHRKVNPIKSEIMAQPDNPRCIVNLFKTYLNLIPDGPLYKKQSDTVSMTFNNRVIGKNKLSDFMKDMFNKAGIDISTRNISGHSGRVTLCTNLFNEGAQEKSVKERSGTAQIVFLRT